MFVITKGLELPNIGKDIILRRSGLFLCLPVSIISISVLIGWALHIEFLKSVFPGFVSMKVNTAIGLLMSSTATGLLLRGKIDKISRIYLIVSSILIILLAALPLTQELFNFEMVTNQWLLQERNGSFQPTAPFSMAPTTAYCLILISIALMFSQSTSNSLRRPILCAVATIIILIPALELLSFVTMYFLDFIVWGITGMAIHTAIGFVLLGVALLFLIAAEAKIQWSIDKLTTVLFIFGMVLLLISSVEARNYIILMQKKLNMVAHVQETLKEIREIDSGLADIDSARRGYIITGDEFLLENSSEKIGEIYGDIEDVHNLTADSPAQQQRISELKPIVDEKIEWGWQSTIARKQHGFVQAQRMIASGKGIALSKRISELLNEMEREENIELIKQEKEAKEISIKTFFILPLQAFFSLSVLSFGIFLNNTSSNERKRAEDALKRNQAQLQFTFDNMVEPLIVVDLEGNIIQSNHAAITLLGLTDQCKTYEDFVAMFDLSLPNGDPLPKSEWPLIRASRGDFLHKFELIILNKNTKMTNIVEVTTAPIKDNSGLIIQYIISYNNITEHKQYEVRRALLDSIVTSSADAILSKSLDSIVTSWNAAAEKIFGYTAEEMIGKSIMCIYPEERRQEELRIVEKIKNGETIEHFETVRLTKEHKLIDVSITVSPIRDTRNIVIGISAICRDITIQKKLESQLQQSQKMEAIGHLTGGIAHDFNNLLAVIIGNLELLEHQTLNEPSIKRVQTIQKAALRGADLTKRLLSFARQQNLNPAPTYLKNCIENMIEMASRTLGPEIKFRTMFDESMPPAFVDAAGLETALLNLAVNSRDAMPDGGLITISTQLIDLDEKFVSAVNNNLKPGHYAKIMLSDTGCGMPPDILARAFEPFFTTKPRGKGTGLGLSMVYGFITQSGGIARIYSEVGHGTTVSIYLPLADGIEIPIDELSVNVTKSKASGKILVVDDEVDLLEVAVFFLEEMGYKVVEAVDGTSAIAILQRERDFDLLVTDVIMPGGMNGVQLAHKAIELIPGLKVIYTSGFPSEALAERSGMEINNPLINKPYSRKSFIEMINKVMEQK